MTGKEREKLRKLAEIEGYADVDALIRATALDSVSPAICMNADCDYTADLEPDQARGWCEACNTNSMKSAQILAGLI